MLEDAYRRLNNAVAPDDALVRAAVAAGQRAEKRGSAPIRRRTARRILLAAALLICLGLALPALAAGAPSVYALMYAVSPAIAQFFMPVQVSCESDGIRMEVVSTYVHGSEAEFYITLQDLTGERVDASIDLYDSYGIDMPFDSMGSCHLVDYDPATKTATFLVWIATMDGRDIPGGKATFSVACFLSGKRIVEDEPLALDWSAAEKDPKWRYSNEPAGGGILLDPATGEETAGPRYDRVLTPGAPVATLFDGFTVTAMGWLDGRLHLQLYTPGRMEYDDHAFLTLKNEQGDAVNGDMVYHHLADSDAGRSADYIDYVFDVPEASLSDYTLYGSFYAAKSRTDGNWRVTFPLTNAG